MKNVIAFAVVAACSASALADPQQVFFDDFESGASSLWSGGGTVQGTQGFSGVGFGAGMMRNADAPATNTTLTLTNLPAHDSISLNCLVGIIDSWDGIGGSPGPDGWRISIDGVPVFDHIFAIASGGGDYNPPAGVFIGSGQYGFNGGWGDVALNLGNDPSLDNIAHTASSVVIDFTATGPGWQGSDDESWAIDNVEVIVNTVPAPGSLALLSAGSLLALRRRR